ncbi:hypothetical protein BYT27DRAFT_7196671 [Phlegmacium glaucopus]|nr:hypothetical protein BYT27DRAFT_7196671 [Phlegmacium glaucopus]
MSFDSDVSGFYRSMGMTPPVVVRQPPYGGRPKFVKLAPGDKGEFLPDVFFEDPRTFTPQPGPLGEIHAWGLYPYFYDDPDLNANERNLTLNWPAFDGVQAAMRQMKHQTLYFGGGSPESQFMKVVLERKRQNLKAVDLKGLDKCDILVKITIAAMEDKKGQPRVWRRFRVSAGISISAFQDKAVAPIMGWVRNFHCYTFTDFRDGALFGPESSDSIDRVHIAQVGYDYLPDDKYKLAHLFGKEGDKIGYLYDFGDKWYHTIEIEKIYSREESNGAIEVLNGKGMCPGENMHGSLQYEDFLNDYDAASYKDKVEKKREILQCPNYKSFGKPPSLFDPATFDVQAARGRLLEALSGPNSVRSGSKKFSMPMMPGGEAMLDEMGQKYLKKGQSIIKKPDDESLGYWHETKSSTKDRRREAVCASCGKPAAQDVQLKTCSGCRQVLYCSAEHQKSHWKSQHKKQCTRQYLPQTSNMT